VSLQPDMMAAAKFLRLICGQDDRICFQTIANAEASSQVNDTHKTGSLRELFPWLCEQNQEGKGIYAVINATNGKGRKTEDIVAVNAVFVDLDGAPLGPIMAAKLKPHAIVETSEKRFHAFWRVDSSVGLSDFTPIQRELAKKFLGDPQVVDLPRVMRLPGFFHVKGVPFQSRIMASSKHHAYTKREIIEGLELVLPGPVTMPDDESSYPIPRGQRNRTMVTISARLRNAGFGGKALFEAMQAVNTARCDPPLTDVELLKIAKWAGGKEAGIVRPVKAMPTDKYPAKKTGQCFSWQELRSTYFKPVQWIIKDLLPEGLCVLAGRPKAGKSWLVQHLCLSVASGRDAMGHFSTNKGQILSISLEDSPRRFKGRMEILSDGQTIPAGAFFMNEFPSLPDFVQALEEKLQSMNEPRLVVVDTLAKIRSRSKNNDAYERDYQDIGSIQKVAGKYQVAIILVHHQRKADVEDDFDSVSGTAAITGAADTLWVLKRPDRSKMQGTLVISGRDISDRQYALQWEESKGTWLYTGTASDAQTSQVQQQILDAMVTIGTPATHAEIAAVIGKSRTAIWKVFPKLLDSGLVERSAGSRSRFILAAAPIPCEDPYPASFDAPYDEEPPQDVEMDFDTSTSPHRNEVRDFTTPIFPENEEGGI
jgi:hypothetical protein